LLFKVAGFWLIPIRVQEECGASAAQETRARRQPDELWANIESAVSAKAAGENRPESAAGLFWTETV